SPAPRAPMTWAGNMIASPRPRPASDDITVTPEAPLAASTRPAIARLPVMAFGTRRVRKSMIAPAPAPTSSVATAIKLEGCIEASGNRLPQHVIDDLAERRDASDRSD